MNPSIFGDWSHTIFKDIERIASFINAFINNLFSRKRSSFDSQDSIVVYFDILGEINHGSIDVDKHSHLLAFNIESVSFLTDNQQFFMLIRHHFDVIEKL